jgi:hypothetical protein
MYQELVVSASRPEYDENAWMQQSSGKLRFIASDLQYWPPLMLSPHHVQMRRRSRQN